MKSLRAISIAIVLVQLIACSKDSPSSTGKLQGLHQYYFPNGKLYLEVNYKDSLAHGLVKRYAKSGALIEESNYRQGVLHGLTKIYHENGNLSAMIPYDSGRVHGVKKKYRKDGSPASEAPYYFGQPCTGLVELYLSGRPVDNYPHIVIGKKRDPINPNTFIFELRLSDSSKRVQFYEGQITEEKYISPTATPIKTTDGVGKIVYVSASGNLETEFEKRKLNVIAKIKTVLGNEYITEKPLVLKAW